MAFAQDHQELNAAMKTAGAASGSLRKTIAAKDRAETAATAEKLAAAFKTVQAHFEEHHMEDGIKFDEPRGSRESRRVGQASDEFKTLGAQWQACHAAHREKLPNGSYKMK